MTRGQWDFDFGAALAIIAAARSEAFAAVSGGNFSLASMILVFVTFKIYKNLLICVGFWGH